MALDADPLERHITGRTVMVTGAAASMGFLVHNWPPARIFMGDFILDTTFTLFRRLIRRVTSVELLVGAASCAAAAACIPSGPAVRIALVVSVAAGISCVGLWVWGKERTPEPGRS